MIVLSMLSTNSTTKKHCQDGKTECGYLIGMYCKADRNHPFIVTRQINEALAIVGCQSWNKYLEWSDERTNKVP